MEAIIIVLLCILPVFTIYYAINFIGKKPPNKKEVLHSSKKVKERELRSLVEYKVKIKYSLRNEIIGRRVIKKMFFIYFITFVLISVISLDKNLPDTEPFIFKLILLDILIMMSSTFIVAVFSTLKGEKCYFEEVA